MARTMATLPSLQQAIGDDVYLATQNGFGNEQDIILAEHHLSRLLQTSLNRSTSSIYDISRNQFPIFQSKFQNDPLDIEASTSPPNFTFKFPRGHPNQSTFELSIGVVQTQRRNPSVDPPIPMTLSFQTGKFPQKKTRHVDFIPNSKSSMVSLQKSTVVKKRGQVLNLKKSRSLSLSSTCSSEIEHRDIDTSSSSCSESTSFNAKTIIIHPPFSPGSSSSSSCLPKVEKKKFSCRIGSCEKVFTRKYDRDRHARSHTGDKPYKCEGCEQSFARTDGLHRHHVAVQKGRWPSCTYTPPAPSNINN